MKKIESLLLLSCRSPFLDDAKIYVPMANLYLKSYVNKYLPNINVTIGDDNYDLSNPEMFEPYDAIGLSIMTPQREEASKILHTIKQKYPEKIVIAGGPHVKHYLGDILRTKEQYDYLIPLDGEKALTGILSGDTEKFIHSYSRTGRSKDRKSFVLENYECPRIINHFMTKDDISNQPRPDRTSQNAMSIVQSYHYSLGGRASTTMMTSRGCPEHCTFCEDAQTAVKWSSLDNLIMEMEDIKNLGYGGVYIFDDLFAIAKDKVEPIVKELYKRDLIYRCNSQARYFTKWGEEFAKLLSDTGCYEIAFGAETGSQKILDNIEKRTTIDMNYKTVEYANKHGIIVKAFMLLGLPGEDETTLKETETFIDFLMNNSVNGTDKRNDFGAYVYMPFKGTYIRDSLDRGEEIGLKMLVPEVSGAYGVKGGETSYEIQTKDLSAQSLKEFRNYLVEKYRPVSSKEKWKNKFHDTHLVTNVEYGDLIDLDDPNNGNGEQSKLIGKNK